MTCQLLTVRLADILGDLCQRLGVPYSVDASVDVEIQGYIVTKQMPARAALEGVMQAHLVDAYEADGRVVFIRRGGGIRARYTTDDLAAHDHGATSAGYTLLRLPHEVAGLFREWLDWHAPEKTSRIMSVLYDLRGGRANDANFGSRMKGLGHFADLIRQRFDLACRRLGLAREFPKLDTARFTPPPPPKPANERQLSLF